MSKNRKGKLVNIYSKENIAKDEKSFDESLNNNKPIDWSSFKRLFVRDLCINTSNFEINTIGNISFSQIKSILEHPQENWREVLRISDCFMKISPHYYRLNNYFSNMALFCWGIDLYDVKDNAESQNIKDIYRALASKLEQMNLKHEFSKIMEILPYQDIYCGLIVESPNNFFIHKIAPSVCSIFQVQDGLYNFKIDLKAIKPKDLNSFPDYVRQAYVDYFEDKSKTISHWYVPPADKQICLKLNNQWVYPYPILIGLIRDVMDLDVYKKLKLQSARTDNYKAIMMEVPIDKSTVDKPLLTSNTLAAFAEINRENMSNDIGLIYTLGSSGEPISFKDSNNTRNNVSDANDEIYNSSGVSKELYNGSSSGTALTYSIENDSGYIYRLYRQFERWVNRYIKTKKYNKATFKFHFYLLDMTIFNRDNVTKRYKEACTLGVPVVDKFLSALDMTPSRTLGSYILHNDVFDFYNKFKPLTSSYNTTSEVGRPTNESNGELLSEEGEKTAEGEKNSL